jgi:hypothetical protein
MYSFLSRHVLLFILLQTQPWNFIVPDLCDDVLMIVLSIINPAISATPSRGEYCG